MAVHTQHEFMMSEIKITKSSRSFGFFIPMGVLVKNAHDAKPKYSYDADVYPCLLALAHLKLPAKKYPQYRRRNGIHSKN